MLTLSLLLPLLQPAHAEPIGTIDGEPIEPDWARGERPTDDDKLRSFASRADQAIGLEIVRLATADLGLDLDVVEWCVAGDTDRPEADRHHLTEHLWETRHAPTTDTVAFAPAVEGTFKAYLRQVEFSGSDLSRVDTAEATLRAWAETLSDEKAPPIDTRADLMAAGLPCNVFRELHAVVSENPFELGAVTVHRDLSLVTVNHIVAVCDADGCEAIDGAARGFHGGNDQFVMPPYGLVLYQEKLDVAEAELNAAGRATLDAELAFRGYRSRTARMILAAELAKLPADTQVLCAGEDCALRSDFDATGPWSLFGAGAEAVFARRHDAALGCLVRKPGPDLMSLGCSVADQAHLMQAMSKPDGALERWALRFSPRLDEVPEEAQECTVTATAPATNLLPTRACEVGRLYGALITAEPSERSALLESCGILPGPQGLFTKCKTVAEPPPTPPEWPFRVTPEQFNDVRSTLPVLLFELAEGSIDAEKASESSTGLALPESPALVAAFDQTCARWYAEYRRSPHPEATLVPTYYCAKDFVLNCQDTRKCRKQLPDWLSRLQNPELLTFAAVVERKPASGTELRAQRIEAFLDAQRRGGLGMYIKPKLDQIRKELSSPIPAVQEALDRRR
ncbi:MAG: hypothetical protein AB8H79_07835 [Myxococcota bacterium]